MLSREESPRLVAVILCRNRETTRRRLWRRIGRRVRKAARIGIVGTIHGLMVRSWYGRRVAALLEAPDLRDACERLGLPLHRIDNFLDRDSGDLVQRLNIDVAVSLGNGYIPATFFTKPRLGMINVHHELLPKYRGAQTALWQIHDGSRLTGYSIHKISRAVDAGEILRTEALPITFGATLRDTLVETSVVVQRRSLDGLMAVLANIDALWASATLNDCNAFYTTPHSRALLRIYKNHRRLRSGTWREGAETSSQ